MSKGLIVVIGSAIATFLFYLGLNLLANQTIEKQLTSNLDRNTGAYRYFQHELNDVARPVYQKQSWPTNVDMGLAYIANKCESQSSPVKDQFCTRGQYRLEFMEGNGRAGQYIGNKNDASPVATREAFRRLTQAMCFLDPSEGVSQPICDVDEEAIVSSSSTPKSGIEFLTRKDKNSEIFLDADAFFEQIEATNSDVKSRRVILVYRWFNGWIQKVTTFVAFVGFGIFMARRRFASSSLNFLTKKGQSRSNNQGPIFLNDYLLLHGEEGGAPIDKGLSVESETFEKYLDLLLQVQSDSKNKFEISVASIIHESGRRGQVGKNTDDYERIVLEKLENREREIRKNRTPLRTIMVLLPSLGFIGTIYGLSESMGIADLVADPNLNDLLKPASVQALVGKLAVAFDTTLVALIFSAALIPLSSWVESQEDNIQIELHRRLYNDFIHRLNLKPAG